MQIIKYKMHITISEIFLSIDREDRYLIPGINLSSFRISNFYLNFFVCVKLKSS